MKRILALMFACVLFCLCGSVIPYTVRADACIDNSDVMPPYLPDEQVQLEDSGNVYSPDWLKTLILVQVRIETATPEGTFQAAVRLLDHYQETGVNGLWLTPIYDRTEASADENGYGNLGLHTVWPKLTGCDNYEDGWKVVKAFVDEAHKRNIRIFFDVVSWGTTSDAPLCKEHPEFYSGTPGWGGQLFAWHFRSLQEWFAAQAVDLIMKTGADGFRCDLEPTLFGYDMYNTVRGRLLDNGRKIAILSEIPNDRKDTYDFEENGVGMVADADNNYTHEDDIFLGKYDLVDSVLNTGCGIGSKEDQLAGKGGTHRFYSYCIQGCNHFNYVLKGSRLRIGYNALFAPFIPIWFMGDEFNNDSSPFWGTTVMYFSRVMWEQKDLPENRAFFEDVKRMIRIRRTYPELFEYFPDSLRDTNICAVKCNWLSGVNAYARYAEGKIALVIPNDDTVAAKASVTIPYAATDFTADCVRITDLMTGKVVAEGDRADLSKVRITVDADAVGVLLVEAVVPPTAATTVAPTAPVTAVPTSGQTTTAAATTVTAVTTASAATQVPSQALPSDAPAADALWVYVLVIVLSVAVLGGSVAVIVVAVSKKNIK